MASLGDDLLKVVNKLQDLVFNTIGNDSLDLPQIVSTANIWCYGALLIHSTGGGWFSIFGQILRARKHRRQRLPPPW